MEQNSGLKAMIMLLKPNIPCKNCVLFGDGCGYIPASGPGSNGVLVVLEAGGEQEAKEGTPTVGKAGHFLWSTLARCGIDREEFRVHNVLSCRPPENKLSGMSFEDEAILTCSPLLDDTINRHVYQCKEIGKTPVIIALGLIASRRIIGLKKKDELLQEDFHIYPFWVDKYQCWVISSFHPAFIMRGSSHLIPVLQFAFQRALEIAEHGLQLDNHQYLLDPEPATFQRWIEDYLRVLDHDPNNTYLSYDIETPWKQGKSEEKVAKEDNDDYTILRCSFAYRPNEAVSVPWTAQYMPSLEELFATDGQKMGWNSSTYDDVRILNQLPMNGDRLDGMLAWHVLNSALPKSLGFVTPFYAKQSSMWKHLSSDQPAFYNAKDADMALRNFIGIKQNLIDNNQWGVFERHVVVLNRVFDYMSNAGVLRDEVMRSDAEAKLAGLLGGVESEMDTVVPQAARKLKVYKKTPKSVDGLIQIEQVMPVKRCSICKLDKPLKAHFKPVGAKKLKLGLDNVCEDATTIIGDEVVKLWAKPLEFKVSKVGLLGYQAVMGHRAILDKKEKKITFDKDAITRLIKQYPNDPLYPLISKHTGYQKLLGTYVGVTDETGRVRGGMPIGKDGKIHTLFTHNPSTLRSASQNPNLQNLPRPKGKDDLATIIRNLIVADKGSIFTARDYSGIEAVLVGYFAMAPGYVRLAKIDVHSFYTAYALNQLDGRVKSNDLPLLSWDDEKLSNRLAEIKSEFKTDRNNLYKHLVHGANFMQGAKGAKEKIFHDTGIEHPVKTVQRVMDIYFELFPEIQRWHNSVMLQAEKDGFIRNPFGYVHRFNRVFEYEKIGGKWVKHAGSDGNKVIAFLPQSTAAGIIKEAMLRLYYQKFEEAGQWLRLLIHDELFFETPADIVSQVDMVVKEEMERPIPQLPLPASYQMGKELVILTEAKQGNRWGGMH